jgi:hypothetical protein
VRPKRVTIAQALEALAPEIDPEMCQVVAAARGVDLGWFVAGVGTSLVDWSPTFDRLRLIGLNERRRSLKVELLRRVRTPGTGWRLIWLPDSPQDAEPFPDGQVAELVPENLDPEESEVILGRGRYRVRVEVAVGVEEEVGVEEANPTSTPKERAISELLDAGIKPQAITWAMFCHRVREKLGKRATERGWSDRTLRRDVTKIQKLRVP